MLQTSEAVVPGSNPASLTVAKTLRTGRVTVYTVKSRGREGNLPLRLKKKGKKYKGTTCVKCPENEFINNEFHQLVS